MTQEEVLEDFPRIDIGGHSGMLAICRGRERKLVSIIRCDDKDTVR